jgi:hypothetical protein
MNLPKAIVGPSKHPRIYDGKWTPSVPKSQNIAAK